MKKSVREEMLSRRVERVDDNGKKRREKVKKAAWPWLPIKPLLTSLATNSF